MRRTFGVMTGGLLMAGLLMAVPASADVTLTSTTTGKVMGADSGGETVVRVKGNKMRSDLNRPNGEGLSTIFDVDANKMITLDHKKKEATVLDVASVGEAVAKVSDSDVQVKLTPTGTTKQVAGQTCAMHDSDVRVALEIAGQKLNMLMTGPVCLSKSAPGAAEYLKFYTTAVQKGFFFTDPRAAKAQPGQAKGFSALYKAWAEAGVPLSSNLAMKFDGGGLLGGMMNKMGGTMATEVTKVDAASIADDVFAPPAGYKVKTQ